MTVMNANSMETVDLRFSGLLQVEETTPIVQTEKLSVFRRNLLAGHSSQSRRAPADMTIQCIQGHVELHGGDHTVTLMSGQLAFLPQNMEHWLKAWEDSVLLLTLACSSRVGRPRLDVVQEASEESFPASDPPSYTPITGP